MEQAEQNYANEISGTVTVVNVYNMKESGLSKEIKSGVQTTSGCAPQTA
jgi:hypothetical protein